ncbi:MAG: DnaJ domain-containing protein [Bacteroidales bacterium]
MVDLYQILGVDKTAGTEEIKRAYRKLAMKYHPDQGGSGASPEQFIKVNKAYQILSVPRRRAWYDQHRAHQQTKSYRSAQGVSYSQAQAAARYRHYQRVVRKEAKTPVWKRTSFLLATMSLMLIFLGAMFFNDLRLLLLKRHQTSTMAMVVTPYSFNQQNENLHYVYKVDDQIVEQHDSRPVLPGVNTIVNDYGIPVAPNDSFVVYYNPQHPGRGIIDLNQPAANTVQKKIKDAAVILEKRLELSTSTARCMINHLYRYKGQEGLGHVLSYSLKWHQSIQYNERSFNRLVKSGLWRNIEYECQRQAVRN